MGERIRQAETLEQDVADLALLRGKMQGRTSAAFLTNLDREIGAKQKELVELADTSPETDSRRIDTRNATVHLPEGASLRSVTYVHAKPLDATPKSADPYPSPISPRPIETTEDRSILDSAVQASVPPQNNVAQQSPRCDGHHDCSSVYRRNHVIALYAWPRRN